jgi:LTXXQ motif family protein
MTRLRTIVTAGALAISLALPASMAAAQMGMGSGGGPPAASDQNRGYGPGYGGGNGYGPGMMGGGRGYGSGMGWGGGYGPGMGWGGGSGPGMMGGGGYGSGMMGMMWGGGYGPGMMWGSGGPFGAGSAARAETFAEGQLAFLKVELKITAHQMPLWDKYVEAVRASAKTLYTEQRKLVDRDWSKETLPQRLDLQERMLALRLETMKQTNAALRPLYAAFDANQKEIADDYLGGGMGAYRGRL